MTLRRVPVETKYFIAGTELEQVGAIRDLGVTIDSKLTFAPHVSDIVRGQPDARPPHSFLAQYHQT